MLNIRRASRHVNPIAFIASVHRSAAGGIARYDHSPRSVSSGTRIRRRRWTNEEGFDILEGEITFQAGEECFVAGAGTFVNMPVGSLHCFRNASDKPARMLISVAPADLEQMFLEVGQPLAPDASGAPATTEADIKKLLAVAPRFGMEIKITGALGQIRRNPRRDAGRNAGDVRCQWHRARPARSTTVWVKIQGKCQRVVGARTGIGQTATLVRARSRRHGGRGRFDREANAVTMRQDGPSRGHENAVLESCIDLQSHKKPRVNSVQSICSE
jgi:hypothetical protein